MTNFLRFYRLCAVDV